MRTKATALYPFVPSGETEEAFFTWYVLETTI